MHLCITILCLSLFCMLHRLQKMPSTDCICVFLCFLECTKLRSLCVFLACCALLSIDSFRTRFQICRLVYNCIDSYGLIICVELGMRIVFNSCTLMLKELLLQIPANSFSFTSYFFSFLRFVMSLTGWDASSNPLLTQRHLILLQLSSSFVSTVMAGVYLDIMLTYFVTSSLTGTRTNSQNVNYSYSSRFLILMVRWWHYHSDKGQIM